MKPLLDKRPFPSGLSFDVIECLANMLQLDVVLCAQGSKDVSLGKVVKRQQQQIALRQLDDASKLLFSARSGVTSPFYPSANCGGRNVKIMRRFENRVGFVAVPRLGKSRSHPLMEYRT